MQDTKSTNDSIEESKTETQYDTEYSTNAELAAKKKMLSYYEKNKERCK